MDLLQFISSIIGSLAWPSVVAYLLYLLRAQLSSLAERLTELSLPGGTKALFSRELKVAQDKVLDLAAGDQPDQLRKMAGFLSDESVKINPRRTITQTLVNVTDYIKKRISEAPLDLRQEPYDFVFHTLYNKQGEKDLYDTFTRIREISSVAYNASEQSISMKDAKSYSDVCSLFLTSFDKAFDNWIKSI